MGGAPPLGIFVDHFRIFNSRPMQHLKWRPLRQNIGNGWTLLLTAVTKSFILNPTPKRLDKFRSSQ